MKKYLNLKFVGILLVLEGFLIFIPTILLGSSINWPQVLDEPASVVLPLIYQQAVPTTVGYYGYLVYSILFFPAVALTAMVASKHDQISPTITIAIVFSGLSALARSIGILRWLTVMPLLANMYQGGVANQEMIAIVFEAIDAYGGSIGEDLGVSIFASLAIGLLSFYTLKHKTLPTWASYLGLISALAILIPSVSIFGIDVGIFNVVSVSILQVWFMAVGGYFLIGKSHRII